MKYLKGIVAGALLLTVLGGGVYKRHTEKSMPISYSVDECAEKILRATEIEMREIPFSWGKSYNITVAGERVGTIYEKVFSWGNHFDFYAGTKENGKSLGHAEEHVFSFGHKSSIYDQGGNEVGKLDEIVLSFNPGHLIEIYNSQGRKLAVSDERALSWTHETDLMDATGKNKIGGTVKSAFWDNYTINFPAELDRRLILGLVAMEDKLDDEKESKSSSKSDK